MSDSPRSLRVVPLAEAMGAIGSEFGALTEEGIAERKRMSDYWDAQDARIAAERLAEDEKYAAAIKLERRQSFERHGWPKRALDAAENANVTHPTLARIAAWDERVASQSMIVISGGAGTGKTTAAAWWALRRRVAPRFLRAAAFSVGSKFDNDKRDEWFDADALVLDDLGAEYVDVKGAFLSSLDELIDVFYGAEKPLIITTNCTAQEFKKRYGERISDRIRECGAWFGDASGSLRKKLESP